MFRIGIGYDIHSFDTSKTSDHKIILCGEAISHKYTVVAHSDGDVGLHSLTDAMLGSVAMGSIGVHFPPSDPKWKNCSSEVFVKHAHSLVTEKGYKICNIDMTIICEEPKIMPHALKMRMNIANMLEIHIDQVNIKAVTAEKLDSIGQGKGIAAHAVVLIQKI